MELYAVIDDEMHVYLIMEYCRGGDLFKRLAAVGGCMDEGWVSSQACPLMYQRDWAACHRLCEILLGRKALGCR